MPQHLSFEVEGHLVGLLSTGNKGGTKYDVRLCVPEIGIRFSLPDVDTGVQRQPQERQARLEDRRDEFTHARRCIAAAVATSDRLVELLREQDAAGCAEVKPITMRLMTNRFDRGPVQVEPINDKLVNVVVIIGVGTQRVPNASPKDKCELAYESIDASGTTTQTERALKVLKSIGPDLLRSLEDRAFE
jgi:hypothetical protein